jgi:hypothetical protein
MLNLHVPATDPVLKQTTETRPKAVSAWLNQLPLASPMGTAQQLLMALYTLNRHPLDADDRYALLALYRPVVTGAVSGLEALLTESAVPPNEAQRHAGTLLRELQIEHSIGYKQVLLSLTSPRFGRANPKRAAEVVGRLLAALRDIQTACHLAFMPLPAGLWQEMHQLYAYAQASGLADLAEGDAPPASLAYRQALLIALADPPHMNPAELLHTRLYLGKFGGLAQLGAALTSGHPGFPIDVDTDSPPSPLAAGQPTGGLWLDTDALCRHLHDAAHRLRKGETPGSLGLPPGLEDEATQVLFARLLKQWSGGAQRAFKRYVSAGNTVQVVTGVSAIHQLLSQETAAGRPDEPAGADSLQAAEAGWQPAAPAAIQPTRWTVDNDSATGLALSGAPNAPLKLKVGDPLALRADEESAWSLGVIRWVRMRDARQVELGVERLSPQIQPVWLRTMRGQHKAHPEAALFVPGQAALKQQARLLLPRNLYQIGFDAEIWHGPHQHLLTFGRCLEHTPSFDLIDFTLFEDTQP